MMNVLAFLVAVASALVAAPFWQIQASGTQERLRAVSAVSDRVAWASGNKGTVLRTTNGGASWMRLIVPGTDDLDFRDVEAFDAYIAYVLSIGPGNRSRIYKTTDGGTSWKLQFTNDDPKGFYDAIAFWDEKHGVAVGDPVDGRFAVIRTSDGGTTWSPVPQDSRPQALPGDGMFAASGTCLVVQGRSNAWIGTGGGARARILRSTDQGASWSEADTPIAAGAPSAGIFSIAFDDGLKGVTVGGDYRKEQEPSDNLARTTDGGKTWSRIAATRLRAFRSGVVFVPGSSGNRLIVVGPSGTDLSVDGGATWSSLGDVGFHAVGIERGGRTAWAVGDQGRIGKLTI
ncbi:MAG TPA: hypothetical protein VGK32_17860 [Vicinamibacterales bacterium]|jgi:photosystem II stability/assembly factor-like uncharacterized protein